jgi:hypothetical protein
MWRKYNRHASTSFCGAVTLAEMGRPPKAPDEKASAQLNVRLTAEERRQLDWLAVELRERSAGGVLKRALAELYARVRGGRS